MIKKSAILVLTVLLIATTSCKVAQKMVERGDYDGAISLLTKKLIGKKKKKAQYVEALEYAFAGATERDMSRIKALQREGRGENLERIYDVQKLIQRRQNRINPLLPLYDENGYKADFKFVRVDEMMGDTRKKAAEFSYAKAQNLLKDARRGDKIAARKAYDELDKIKEYYGSYRDRDRLMADARELGKVNILFRMKNQSATLIPRGFESEILRMSVGEMNSLWKEYHTRERNGIDYDYEIAMRLTHIDVSPETFKEREYIDRKEIEDGFEYVLDQNGNVAKDTLGNDIKVPRKVTIEAIVLETCQVKEARVSGRLEYIDRRTNSLLKSERVTAEAIFNNFASTFRGDSRALSDETRRYLGNRPISFPTDEDLLLDAAEHLKPVIKQKIVNNRGLI